MPIFDALQEANRAQASEMEAQTRRREGIGHVGRCIEKLIAEIASANFGR